MEPFLGEIQAFAYNRVPQGWHVCDGSQMPIAQNPGLYALLGTRYGGDGATFFNLPDLRGRTPVGYGTDAASQTMYGGTEAVTLTLNQMPAHVHAMGATSQDGNIAVANNAIPATAQQGLAGTEIAIYANTSNPSMITALAPDTVSSVGGGGGHNNMQPYTTVQFCIAVTGVFPQRQ